MVAGSFTKESASPATVERLWKIYKDVSAVAPKLMPDHFLSIDILEGDGGAGTVKQINFGPAVKEFKYLKERLEVLDDANHVFKFTVFEGGIIGLRLKSYSVEVKFEAGSDGSSVLKFKVEYDTLDDTLLSEEEQEQFMLGPLGLLKVMGGYLLADSTAYA